MKKLNKSRKGFTLVEMVLVIAIIVILAAVLVMGIGTYMERARAAASSVTKHNTSISIVSSIIDDEVGLA
ncbi:MAG: type II secretion system protein [Clostridiales bacterium]|jgi:type IV pilus assembly protein PilA|nr:type II secretion system protein [Clostridiales bacterium]